MSRFFIILLIALLPLRGWSVERMAVHMAASASAAQAMPSDCPMMIQTGASASDAGAKHLGDSSDKGDYGKSPGNSLSCQSCQLCMSLATPDTPAIQPLAGGPRATTAARAERFASADLPRATKPPIF